MDNQTLVQVVTANIGGIDEKKEIPAQTVAFMRHYYTELANLLIDDDRTKALAFKARAFTSVPIGSITIWLDGKIQPLSADFLDQILTALGDGELAVMKHLYRSCIYEEIDHIEHCIKAGNEYLITRYAHKPIRAQVEAYRYFGYPANAGLFDCCIMAFRHTERTAKLGSDWWADIRANKAFD